MVPVQLGILSAAQEAGRVKDIANAWNYLSVLYHKVRRYDEAEKAAQTALSVYEAEKEPSEEVVACYEFVLARILAAQGRFEEAIPIAESAAKRYAVRHDPNDNFMRSVLNEVARMREYQELQRRGNK
jgi:tetratricopeptide (TPR) repeat protein